MENIKFRMPVFDSADAFRMWHYWGFIEFGDSFTFSGIYSDNYSGMTAKKAQEVSQQYINEKDKNGREIYEGDWLKTDETDWIAKVVFNRAGFFLIDDKGGFSVEPNWDKCEVIKNDYQNFIQRN